MVAYMSLILYRHSNFNVINNVSWKIRLITVEFIFLNHDIIEMLPYYFEKFHFFSLDKYLVQASESETKYYQEITVSGLFIKKVNSKFTSPPFDYKLKCINK